MPSSLQQNNLSGQASPYLRQHQKNPVHWQAWRDELFHNEAPEKLLIISIGYSSCHWCHVMEHECFEDREVAALMNDHYVSIKVDREEHPDVDELYMTALQLMRGQGGWPLNIIALPDGRPVWGATYLPKARWMKALTDLQRLFKDEPEKFTEYAQQLTKGLQKSQLIALPEQAEEISGAEIGKLFRAHWPEGYDQVWGGFDRSPKFPLPGHWSLLLQLAVANQDDALQQQIELTLQKMAWGGIYDQIGGGFARYSVDPYWKVPHFEKMLYDNGQLLSLYAEAYRQEPKDLYAQVLRQSISFLQREMRDESGGYYSALDADSEGSEGAFYRWTKEELQGIIDSEEWAAFSDYYGIDERGYWEEDYYLLVRSKSDADFCHQHNLSPEGLEKLKTKWLTKLSDARDRRVRPGLDDKVICSWNALLLSGLCESFKALGDEEHRQAAKALGDFMLDKLVDNETQLWRIYHQGNTYREGLLEDYAFFIKALLDLFEISGDLSCLKKAHKLNQKLKSDFLDPSSGYYFQRSRGATELIARSQESLDNVIPSGNAQMAENLIRLALLNGELSLLEQSRRMVSGLKDKVKRFPESHYLWAKTAHELSQPNWEVVIIGPEAEELYCQIARHFLPGVHLAWSEEPSNHYLFKNRWRDAETLIYPCQTGACQQPVKKPAELWEVLGNGE